ncbi:hypothetical protein DU500_07820 [Haloplanus rubicundus]|uniref:Uncharacterized protein n=1 Tax=Haloplanus rubicundus TaxID=1547898 RepID=A0A345E2C3_9EURY|nr:hypothetical protein [Haloplanus rubicundus]AXG06345.1 hypothetical protein DU500_07820 [Haloplanus rubicundus]
MTNPETTMVFAGLDGRTKTHLPAWYARQRSSEESKTFTTAVRALPQATTTEVAYHNPYVDEWMQTDRHNAIVEPTRLAKQAGGETNDDPLFFIPTDSYSVINPLDIFGPLEAVLQTETIDGRPLAEVMFGEVRQYRDGGEVHMDILFDGLTVDLPGRSDPITMGVTAGYDFFGGHAVYVEGFARDTACANSIRQLTDRETVKHVGDVGDFEQWWQSILAQLGLVANDLCAFIEAAGEITIQFTDVPFTLSEFYTLLGLPEYLAQRAAEDARAEAETPTAIDMWTLHSGATYALTHFFTGREGVALDRYVRAANDILFNPEVTIETVTQAYEERAAAETDGMGQTGLESQLALAQLERVGQDVRAKATQFQVRAETLKERLNQTHD